MSNTLSKIQAAVKAPKGQFNKFGNYKYRSCEDIVEAVKLVINPEGFYLTLTDEVVNIGNRFYIKATATISNGEESFSCSAFAREEEQKKGMDGAQITGAASSYARKYALNGLFAIDDTKDADSTNTHDKEDSKNDANDGPDDGEKNLLRNLVHGSDLNTTEKQRAFDAIDSCKDYTKYDEIRLVLEARQLPIDQIQNPSQKQINKHLKNAIA